jgi:N-acylneuraminate cytidylyltransferase
MRPDVVGFVFARGGSKGVPRKNLRPFAGKPLIAHAIAAGLSCGRLRKVVVSTDDPEIAEVARAHGAAVPFLRPAELARDDSPEWLAWKHAIGAVRQEDGPNSLDVLVSIPTTAPLRSPGDIAASLDRLLQSNADLVLTVTPADPNPIFNSVQLDSDGAVRRLIETHPRATRRQDVPQVLNITTVAYAARANFVLQAESCWEGRVSAVVIPRERAVDIDSEMDLLWAEFLLAHGAAQRQAA